MPRSVRVGVEIPEREYKLIEALARRDKLRPFLVVRRCVSVGLSNILPEGYESLIAVPEPPPVPTPERAPEPDPVPEPVALPAWAWPVAWPKLPTHAPAPAAQFYPVIPDPPPTSILNSQTALPPYEIATVEKQGPHLTNSSAKEPSSSVPVIGVDLPSPVKPVSEVRVEVVPVIGL